MKRISCVLAKSLEEQMERHRMMESSSLLTRGSSSRRSSKHDTGQRNMMTLVFSKKGNQAARFVQYKNRTLL